jgi:PAS domain S-box-containing protein
MLISTPSAVAALCFVLQYAGLGRWLTRTTLTLLIAPSILMLPAYLLGDARLLWAQVGYVDGRFVRVLAPLGTAWNLYGLAILASTVAVAMLLFVRSPLYRKPAALMMLGHSSIVAVQAVGMRLPAPILQPSLMILSIDLALALYAIALFHYRLFRVVPVARDSTVERMPDAMIVLDAGNRIADLNLAAQRLLGVRRERILGREAAPAPAAVPGLAALAECRAPAEGEVSLEEGGARHWYWVNASPLEDGRGLYLDEETGTVLLTDVSFLGNEGRGLDVFGGGMVVRGGTVTLTNAVFLGNYSYAGGGMFIYGGSVRLINASFNGNRSISGGPAVYSLGSDTRLTNSIVWGNVTAWNVWQIYGNHAITYSSVEDDCTPALHDCTGVISSDPMFVLPANPYSAPTPYGDLHLNRTDRVIGVTVWDNGDNAAVTVPTDRDGNPRIVNGTVDMGAYETQDTAAPTGTISINAGAEYTNHPYVTLTLSAEDDQSTPAQMQMMVSNYQFFSGAVWEPFSDSKPD